MTGLDLSTLFSIASMEITLDAGDPDLSFRSASAPMVSAVLPHDLPPPSGLLDRDLISSGGRINGVAVWLRLELAPGQILEARPGLAPRGFYARPRFFAFREALETLPGQPFSIRLKWDDKWLDVSLTEHGH